MSAVAERWAAIWELDLGDWKRVESSRSFERDQKGQPHGLETVGSYVLLVGLFVAMVTMFNQVNGRLDAMNVRIDVL